MSDQNCIFCKIINGEIPSEKIYEDEKCFAFLDIHPVLPGHILVIPKNHNRNIFDVGSEDLKSLFLAVKKISVALKQALNCDGINMQNNNEPAAGQVIMHFHVHLIPRYQNDHLRLWPGTDYEPGQISSVAEKIRKEF